MIGRLEREVIQVLLLYFWLILLFFIGFVLWVDFMTFWQHLVRSRTISSSFFAQGCSCPFLIYLCEWFVDFVTCLANSGQIWNMLIFVKQKYPDPLLIFMVGLVTFLWFLRLVERWFLQFVSGRAFDHHYGFRDCLAKSGSRPRAHWPKGPWAQGLGPRARGNSNHPGSLLPGRCGITKGLSLFWWCQ